MARSIALTSGAGDSQALTGGTLIGYSIAESAGTPAVATVVLRHGTLATDPPVAIIELAANGSETRTLPAIDCPNGIFVDRVAGSTEVVVYVA